MKKASALGIAAMVITVSCKTECGTEDKLQENIQVETINLLKDSLEKNAKKAEAMDSLVKMLEPFKVDTALDSIQ